jgi:predicted negative regulator of RcsB-dependent stress response
VEQYRTEEEQVEALKKWWDENGRSTMVAIIVALGLGFGWQGWQKYGQQQAEAASNSYQALLQQISNPASSEDTTELVRLGEEIKAQHARTTYAQFAALHLARVAVNDGDLARAEAELRWVLGRADKGSDTHQVAQLRLARVLAAKGEQEQALAVLESADAGSYQATYAVAKGDTLLMLGRNEEAKAAYTSAIVLASRGGAQINLAMVQQKLQSLSPVAARELGAEAPAAVEAVVETVEEAASNTEAPETPVQVSADEE